MNDPVALVKRSYVGALRLVRGVLRPLGVLRVPADHRIKRWRHWFQSLLAIHDIDELIHLDVPWWTYDAIERVEAFLRAHPSAKVFEYGSGASTVWLARRAAQVVSVDHHASWVDQLRPRLAGFDNVTLTLVRPEALEHGDSLYLSGKSGSRGLSFKAYAEAIDHWPQKFDVIVVDGRARAACLRHAVARLAENGMIVFDNSHRRRYRAAILACGFETIITRGLVPSLPLPDQTTLLWRSGMRPIDG